MNTKLYEDSDAPNSNEDSNWKPIQMGEISNDNKSSKRYWDPIHQNLYYVKKNKSVFNDFQDSRAKTRVRRQTGIQSWS